MLEPLENDDFGGLENFKTFSSVPRFWFRATSVEAQSPKSSAA